MTNPIEAVRSWIDWVKRTNGTLDDIPCDHIVSDVAHAFGTQLQPDANGWLPIEFLPEGRHVLLYWENGERGNGGVETAMVLKFDDRWAYWSHGGPNSGFDWEPDGNERPIKWKPYALPSGVEKP